MIEFQTIDHWDEQIWERVFSIYYQAFGKKGAKPDKVLRNMFHKGIGFLHIGINGQDIAAIAIAGRLKGISALLIDYIAVHQDQQNHGIGGKMINYVKEWSVREGFESIIIEVEAEKTLENLKRIHFWKKCGFLLTDYIHQYIWVPEPYQAMYLNLKSDQAAPAPKSGEELFQYIAHFHKNCFQGA